MTPHLTHEQLCDLILAPPTPDFQETGRLDMLRDHLSVCRQCSAELASLNRSLATFRSTADAWATRERNRPRPSQSPLPARATLWGSLPLPALWTAAAALVVAATLPLALHHNPPATAPTPAHVTASTPRPPNSQSDEALLEEVNETLSSSIPSPMQPLDDPTAGRHNQSNNQRKN